MNSWLRFRSFKWLVVALPIDIGLLVVSSNRLAIGAGAHPLYVSMAVVTACLIPVFLILYGYAHRLKLKEHLARHAMQDVELGEEVDDPEFLKTLSGLPTRFSYQELQSVTGNFSKKLGRGGFGSVYEGELPDGRKVAVKRLEREGRGQKEFCAEVATISRIRHVNLMSLKGFCAERAQRLLVYELMPKGSLDRWLFRSELDDEGEPCLDWETRFSIAVETARGLAYLHEECEERILHLDVKPENILLDDEFRAKVSDFGLSRSMVRGESRLMTTIRGTPGYLAPEWLLSSGIDSKTDVYSYGMVLLELVSGRRNTDKEQSSFVRTVMLKKVREGRVNEVVDGRLRAEMEEVQQYKQDAERCLRVAVWCIQEDASARPTMGTVVEILEGKMAVMELPPLPARDSVTPMNYSTDFVTSMNFSRDSVTPMNGFYEANYG